MGSNCIRRPWSLWGHLDELHYRLWRGQNRLFMPLLDRVRLDICHILTEASRSRLAFDGRRLCHPPMPN